MVVRTRVAGGERAASLALAGAQLAVDAGPKIGSETGSRRGSDSEPISRRIRVPLALCYCSRQTWHFPALLASSWHSSREVVICAMLVGVASAGLEDLEA